jgi:hypothetical protein
VIQQNASASEQMAATAEQLSAQGAAAASDGLVLQVGGDSTRWALALALEWTR